MVCLILTLCALLLPPLAMAETNRVINTTAELRSLLTENERINVPFRLSGVIECADSRQNVGFTLLDATGAVLLYRCGDMKNPVAKAGDRVRVSGTTAYYDPFRQHIYARCEWISTVSNGVPPAVRTIRCADFASGLHDYRNVQVNGVVRNAFRDEIDPRYSVLILGDGDACVYVHICTDRDEPDLNAYIGAEVRVLGLCDPLPGGNRLHLGRILTPRSLQDVTIVRSPHNDIFAVPNILSLRGKSARAITMAGRHKAIGRVMTRWENGRQLILKTDDKTFVNVELTSGDSPKIGDFAEVSGIPESDLFRVNLNRASWRPASAHGQVADTPMPLSLRDLFTDSDNRPRIHTEFHGHPITVEGIVRSILPSPSGTARLTIENNGYTLPVRIENGQNPPAIGARISAIGVCVIDADPQKTSSSFPRIRDVFLVVNDPAGVTILSAAPFWTPVRLSTVIGTLAVILVGILLWSISLRALVRRRTRELEQEIANGLEAELRIHERTRLATELHDSISQNLTGVALALDDVGAAIDTDNTEARTRLSIAARTLKSCRGELRNCLWDLRNNALEEPEIDDAIRRTLAPHVRDTNLMIRFRAARETFSENTLHTILCIIRELTVNAIRHGGAKNVKIAGSLENDILRFSVADDGCGFDPQTRPNIDSGHFGLQGVQERAENLGGSMIVRSQPGAGSKITISIKVKTATSET